MINERPLVELDPEEDKQDPDVVPLIDRRVFTQPYDLVVESLMDQIKGETIFLRPISDRPNFQRRYVWSNLLASKLIESILLNVPIPPCYLSQNDDFELDVIDGQQRLFSIYKFLDNQLPLSGLGVHVELNGLRFHQLPLKMQRQLRTHTLRCVLITNESHPEIKFDVFERLNSSTVPLNAQELRNCIYRGALNDLIGSLVSYQPWLRILGKAKPDVRMRDEELILRFYSFYLNGLESYRTPQKHWLNEAAKAGVYFSDDAIENLRRVWISTLDKVLEIFDEKECFRRERVVKAQAVNRALFDLVMVSCAKAVDANVDIDSNEFRRRYYNLLEDPEFGDLIGRAVDHTRRTRRRFELWDAAMDELVT